jgi:hypothetical protein
MKDKGVKLVTEFTRSSHLDDEQMPTVSRQVRGAPTFLCCTYTISTQFGDRKTAD